MGVEDERGPYSAATSANTSAPWVTGGKPLDVDLSGLRDYAKHMADQQMDLVSRSAHLGHLAMMPYQAWDGAVLGEASFIRSQMAANASELVAYLGNLAQTLNNIGSAAQTVADIYGSSDATGAADLNDVLFAFGDKNVPRPDGLPAGIGRTYQEALAADAGRTAPPAESSAEWGTPVVTAPSPYQSMATSRGPNGLVRQTVTTSVPGSGVTMVTTTVYDAHGKEVSSTSTRTTNSYDPVTRTNVKTVQTGGNTSTTTTHYATDGDVDREETRSSATTNGQETPTGRREVTVDPTTGQRVETTYAIRDGKEVVTDRVVIGAATEGERVPDDSIANEYDPVLKGLR